MSLPATCVKRPISVFMFYAGVVLFGLISLSFLRQELFPPITYPKLSIITNYENAAPEEIEQLITKPIEEAVGSTQGLKSVTSTSQEGVSVVVAEFGWDQNMDFASLGVREKIDLIKARLPRDSQEPVVIKFNPFDLPIMTISVSSDKRTPARLKRFTEKWFKDEFEKITGVASATLSGGEDEEISVEVDQGRLKATGLAVTDVSKALAAANLNYPGGTIKESFYEYLIRTMGEFKRLGEIGRVPIGKSREGAQEAETDKERKEAEEAGLILLQDIATVRRTVQERTSYSRFNGLENVAVSIQKSANANTIKVVADIKKRLEELEPQMPDDIRIAIVDDQAKFIKQAVSGVRDAALQGGVLAFLVLVVFLQQITSSTFVILITPFTILATFTLMYFLGISLNVISMGGMAVGVGMLTDNAIVLLENAYRHMKEVPGKSFIEHVIEASEEVIAPMFASTLTTVGVFLPMIFVTGIAGQLFKEFAWVIVATQLISIVVAFTLLPVLMVKSGMKEDARFISGFLSRVGKPIIWVQNFIKGLMVPFMRVKWPALFLIFGLFVVSLTMLTKLDRVVMPKIDQGKFMVKVDMPVGTRIEVTNEISRTIEKYLSAFADVENVATVVGSSRGASTKDVVQQLGSHESRIIVNLKERRRKSTERLVQEIRAYLGSSEIKERLRGGTTGFLLYDSPFQADERESAPVVLNIKGSQLDVLKKLAENLERGLGRVKGVYDVTNSFPESSPETKITVNKDKASYYRLSVTDLATAAHISIKGIVATQFKEEGKEIPIRVVLRQEDRAVVSKLPFILMRSPLGISVPLADLVTFTVGRGPSEIRRMDQERTVQVFAKIYGRSFKDVMRDVEKTIKGLKIPENYDVQVAGQSLELEESFKSLRFALILSLILVYMIMAAQFESYFQPFIIMFTMPLGLIGVNAALWLTGTPLSVVVLIGVIMLGGIVVNNGIILVDFMNQLIREGVPLREAALRASSVRLRPILMTACVSVMGVLPLALGQDEGSKLQAPMGIAVMGGLLVATFLTVLVIPAVYTGFMELRGPRQKEETKV